MIKISDYFAGFQRNRDGFAWSYLFITLIIWILGAVFYTMEPAEIDVSKLDLVDPAYVSVLKTFFTENTDAVKKLSLEALGSYEIVTDTISNGDAEKKYDLPELSGEASTIVSRWRDDISVKRVLKDKKFTNSDETQVYMVSPMWFYTHNLHLIDSAHCSTANIASAVATIRGPDTTATNALAMKLKCSPAQPTSVDYRKCYSTIQTRKQFFLIYTILTAVMWFLSLVAYVVYSRMPSPMATVFVDTLYLLATILYTLGCIIFGMEFWNDEDACPHEHTGVQNLYTLLIVSLVFQSIVLAMLIVRHVLNARTLHSSQNSKPAAAPSDTNPETNHLMSTITTNVV